MTARSWCALFVCLVALAGARDGFGAAGWYLLQPKGSFDDADPNPEDPTFWIDYKVPMSRWTHLGAYDSAKECEDGKTRIISLLSAQSRRETKKEQARILVRTEEARCIAGDDPRLK